MNRNLLVTILDAVKSMIKEPASGKGLLTATSHGRRQKSIEKLSETKRSKFILLK
jgi:hypothetical protein